MDEVVRQIEQGPCKLVFCTEELERTAVEAAERCGLGRGRVVVVGDGDGSRGEAGWRVRSADGEVDFLKEEGTLTWERITDRKALEESVVVLLYSSGTTGVPKGVY